jgi:hypothetical protein
MSEINLIPESANKSPINKKIWMPFLLLVIIALICAGFIYWSRSRQSASPTVTPVVQTKAQKEEQLKKEVGALSAKYALEFPKFTLAEKLTASSTPKMVRAFVFDNAVLPKYDTIKYENTAKEKGFLVTYTMANSKINDVWFQMSTLASKENWGQIGGYSSASFAFMEFQNSTSNQIARATFIQKDNSVNIAVVIKPAPKK